MVECRPSRSWWEAARARRRTEFDAPETLSARRIEGLGKQTGIGHSGNCPSSGIGLTTSPCYGICRLNPPRAGRTWRASGSPPKRPTWDCPVPGGSRPAGDSWSRGRSARTTSAAPPGRCWSIRWSKPSPSDPSQHRPDGPGTVVHVLPRPGVTDPEGQSALAILRDLGFAADERPDDPDLPHRGARRCPAPPDPARPGQRGRRAGRRRHPAVRPPRPGPPLPLPAGRGADPARWTTRRSLALSKSGQLYLSLAEMRTIQAPLRGARPRPDRLRARDPGADLERALLAQDPAGPDRVRGRGHRQPAQADDLQGHARPRASTGSSSVFADNAGVVRFDDEHDVCFKVETHNHPSAIDPYGGANTGLGGVIRDPLGTGLGAKPICNTDVFCVAPPDLPPDALAAGRAASAARAQGGGRRGPRLRQPDGHPDRQRGPGGRSRRSWPIRWSSAARSA